MRELSNSLLAQLYAQESDDPFMILFTLNHSSWGSPIYLVNNTESIVSNSVTFSPFPVMVTLPSDDGESAKVVGIEFDNVSQELVDEIRAVTDAGIEVTIQMVLSSDPDTVEIEIGELKLKSVSYNADKISGQLVLDDFLNTGLPSEKYTPNTCPGIF